MKRFLVALLAVLTFAHAASAASVSLTADQTWLLVSTNATNTVTCYDPSKIPGRVVTIKNDTTQAGTTTVATAAGDFDGASTITLTGAGAFVTVRAVGTKYKIIGSSVTAGGGVPSARTVTAGAGLVGGGDLSANRSLDIVAADGTVIVNADSIQVGTVPVGQVSGAVGTTRTISTTAPLQGGGALSSNLTLTLDAATTAALGSIKLAQDLAGTGLLPVVANLTGVSNVVGIPSATKLQWASSGPYASTRDSGLGLNLGVATTNNSIALNDVGTAYAFFNYNSGTPFFQALGLPFQFMTTGANDLRLAATGTGAVNLDGATVSIRSADGGTTFGAFTSSAFTMSVNQIVWGSATSAAILNAKTNTPIVFEINSVNTEEIDPSGVHRITDVVTGLGSQPSALSVWSAAGALKEWGSNTGAVAVTHTNNVAATAAAGGGQATPATVANYLTIDVNGTSYKIPLYSP